MRLVDSSELRTRLYWPLRRLGEYELLKKIGSGGMAEVWMGRRAAMAGASKVVAIKLLARDVLDDPEYRQMFLEEARLSMLLTNSNVVQVFDVGESGEECYMVMEWVDGLNLSELGRKMGQDGERLSTVAVAHVIGEVLRALAYAHNLQHEGKQATIVHRDVSPQNVLVSVSGEVKLADFGVARLAEEETSGVHVKGKLRYMAPEQLRGQSRAPSVDLYAVGAILHELLSGERFRATRDEADLYSMVLNGIYTPLGSEVPEALATLTARLLEPDAALRLQSADHALELLYAWSGYRNSSIELGRLVQKWSGVSGPRSGFLTREIVAAANASVMSAAQTVPVSEPKQAETPIEPATELETAVAADERELATTLEPTGAPAKRELPKPQSNTETRTSVEVAVQDATTLLEPERPVASRVPAMLMGAMFTLALGFGVFGIGFPLGWWGPGAAEQGTIEQEAAAATKGEVVSVEGGHEDAQPDVTTAADSEAISAGIAAADSGAESEESTEGSTVEGTTDTGGSEDGGSEDGGSEDGGSEEGRSEDGDSETGVGEPETGDETDGGETGTHTPPPPPPKKSPPPSDVVFLLGDYYFAYVQVAGKVLTLEPKAKTKLKPGKHAVKIRESEDAPWVKTGMLEIKGGAEYRVRLKKPNGLEVEKL